MDNMLKNSYQKTCGYRVYEAYSKITGSKPFMSFLFMTAFVVLLQGAAFAANSVGMGLDGTITPTDFTKTGTKDFTWLRGT